MYAKQHDGVLKAKVKVELSKMPALRHWADREQPFDIMKSEVWQWMRENPVIALWMFDKARAMGMIAFTQETNRWVGVDNQGGAQAPPAATPTTPGIVEGAVYASDPLT